jgi:hypothetical protein
VDQPVDIVFGITAVVASSAFCLRRLQKRRDTPRAIDAKSFPKPLADSAPHAFYYQGDDYKASIYSVISVLETGRPGQVSEAGEGRTGRSG